MNNVNTIKIEFGFGTGFDKNGNTISPTRRAEGIEEIKRVACELWGGYTLVATEGGWTSPTVGSLIEEPGATLFVFVKSTGSRANIVTMVNTIKMVLRQEAVAVTQTPVNFEII